MPESLPIGFIPVGDAAERLKLSARDPYGQAVYPTAADWKRFQPALVCRGVAGLLETAETALDRAFEESDSGVVFLIGPPGTGKTLHALLYGFQWTERPFRTLLGLRADAYAMYTTVGAFDLSVLDRNWRGVAGRSSRFLWIIDEIDQILPNDPGGMFVQEAIDRFRSERLIHGGHRLICVGQTVPRELSGYPVVNVALTHDSIAVAVRHKQLRHAPPQAVVDQLVETRNTGLKAVMAVATTTPSAQQTIGHYLNAGAEGRLKALSEAARTLAIELARLRFLGLPLQVPPQLAAALTELARRNLVQEAGTSGAWHLTDDELARAILRIGVNAHHIPETFYAPLLDILERDPRTYLAALMVCARRSLSGVNALVGVASPRSADTILTEITTLYPDRIRRHLSTTAFNLTELAEALTRLREHLGDTGAIARNRLHGVRHGIEAALDACDLSTWESVARLAQIAEDSSFNERLTEMLEKESTRAAIRQLPPEHGAVVVELVKNLDKARVREIQRLLLPSTPSEAAAQFASHSSHWMWDFISAKRRLLGRGFMLDALRHVPREFLAEAIYRSPTGARWALRHLPPDPVFREVMEARPPDGSDVAQWASIGPVLDFLTLARRLHAFNALDSTVIVDSIQAIVEGGDARTIRLIAREAHQLPQQSALRASLASLLERAVHVRLDTRLYALSLLSRPKTLSVIRRELQKFAEDADVAEVEAVFWVLWESSARTRGTFFFSAVRRAARAIDSRFRGGEIVDENSLALEGLLCHLTGRSPRDISHAFAAVPLDRLTSAAKAASQMFATAHFHTDAHERTTVFTQLMMQFLSRERLWQDMSGAHRDAVLKLVDMSVHHLATHRCAIEALEEIGNRVVASANESLWDWYPSVLIRLTTMCRGMRAGAQMLKVNALRWTQNLQAGYVTYDLLELLWLLFYMSERLPDVKPEARPLMQALVDARESLPARYSGVAALIAKRAGIPLRRTTAKTRNESVSNTGIVISAIVEVIKTGNISAGSRDALRQLDAGERAFFEERFLRDLSRMQHVARLVTTPAPTPPQDSAPNTDWQKIAEECMKDGRYGQAKDAARATLENDPRNAAARWILVAALEQLGRHDEALVVSRQFDHPGTTQEDYEKAAQAAYQRVRNDPSPPENWRRFATTYIQIKRPADVLSFAAAIVRQRPELHRSIWTACETLAGQRPAAVAQLLTALLEIDPENAAYWNLLGAVRRKSDNHEGAIEAAQRAVTIDPNVGTYWYSLGRAYETLGDVTRAIEAYRRAITLKHHKAEIRLKPLLRRPRKSS